MTRVAPRSIRKFCRRPSRRRSSPAAVRHIPASTEGGVSDIITRRSRLLLLCCTGGLSRGSARRPTRAQPLYGTNRHGDNHLQRHGSRPSHQPFDEIECQVGPKIPHDPASFVAGAPPGSVGHKKKMKKPRPSPAGPQKKSLYAIVSAREKSLVHPLEVD